MTEGLYWGLVCSIAFNFLLLFCSIQEVIDRLKSIERRLAKDEEVEAADAH